MAEIVYNKYQDNIKSFNDFLAKYQPLLVKGRYRGYDTLEFESLTTPSIFVKVKHTSTGFTRYDDLGADTASVGCVITPQGAVIQNDEEIINVEITKNGTNAYQRIDYLVLEHSYISTPGANPSTIFVVKGADGGPVEPSIPNPEKQVLLGKIYIAASGTTFGDLTYVPERIPRYAGRDPYSSYTAPEEVDPTIYTNESVKIYKDDENRVHLKGVFEKISSPGGITELLVLKIPLEYCPIAAELCIAHCYAGASPNVLTGQYVMGITTYDPSPGCGILIFTTNPGGTNTHYIIDTSYQGY